MDFLVVHKFEVVAILWGISELLAQLPFVKANSVAQLLMGGLKALLGIFKKPEA